MIKVKSGREAELFARECLAKPELFAIALKERRWSDVLCVLDFVHADVKSDLAMTDPALYRTLRQQITNFHLRGSSAWNIEKIRALVTATSTTN
jgi:hypothetical protein